MKVDAVYVFPNGMVAVFGGGEQVPSLQGVWEEVRALVEEASSPETKWYGAKPPPGRGVAGSLEEEEDPT